MPYCMAFGCKNDSKDYKRGISFFRLPLKDPARLKVWLAKLQLEDPPIKETSRVCSEHFSEDCFERDLKSELIPGTKPKRTLKPDAVPTLFSFVKSSERAISTQRIKGKEAKQVSLVFACIILSDWRTRAKLLFVAISSNHVFRLRTF